MPTSQRRCGSGWASGPVQIAAVIAARLTLKAPNGARSSDAAPVVSRTGRGRGAYPAGRSTNEPARSMATHEHGRRSWLDQVWQNRENPGVRLQRTKTKKKKY